MFSKQDRILNVVYRMFFCIIKLATAAPQRRYFGNVVIPHHPVTKIDRSAHSMSDFNFFDNP